MNRFLVPLLSLSLVLASHAEFRTWTNSEGQTAELELHDVTEKDGEKAGRFRMKNGNTVVLKVSQLSEADGKLLMAWAPSVFEEALDDNLLVFKDGRMQPVRDRKAPNQYYLFYFTASWCGPCQAYTPSLVEWYNANKNDNFELVLISWDRDKADMLGYAKSKNMPWPQLQLGKVDAFCKEFNLKVNSIPTLLVCERGGKLLGDYRHNLPGLTSLIKE